MNILAVKVNGDNWTYLHPYQPGHCWIVDPSDAASVMHCLHQNSLTPTHILATHHHGDHTAGIAALKKTFGCTTISPDPNRIPHTDTHTRQGSRLILGDWTITTIAAPGHTATGVCYYGTCPAAPPVLYAGDTLFACGCGRLLEGDAKTLYATLIRLAALPDDTRLYPGHDYTEENIRFALTVEPDNPVLTQMLAQLRTQTAFVPTTLAQEKQHNPFLRTANPVIQHKLGLSDPLETFAELRRRKDRF